MKVYMRCLVALPLLLASAPAHAGDTNTNVYYLYVIKNGKAAAWKAFDYQGEDWRKKQDALEARMKAENGVDEIHLGGSLPRGKCGAMYRTSDSPKYYNFVYATGWKELINTVAAMQFRHRASQPYSIHVVDMRCNGHFTPPAKLGRPWSTWKLALQPRKIRKDQAEVVAYLSNKRGELKSWIGTDRQWLQVRDAENRAMSRDLGTQPDTAVVLQPGNCALKLDDPGMPFAFPSSPGLFAARVKARALANAGKHVTWILCSDTLRGKATVQRFKGGHVSRAQGSNIAGLYVAAARCAADPDSDECRNASTYCVVKGPGHYRGYVHRASGALTASHIGRGVEHFQLSGDLSSGTYTIFYPVGGTSCSATHSTQATAQIDTSASPAELRVSYQYSRLDTNTCRLVPAGPLTTTFYKTGRTCAGP